MLTANISARDGTPLGSLLGLVMIKSLTTMLPVVMVMFDAVIRPVELMLPVTKLADTTFPIAVTWRADIMLPVDDILPVTAKLLSTLKFPDMEIASEKLAALAMVRFPPTCRFFLTATPPQTWRAPVESLSASVLANTPKNWLSTRPPELG